MYMDVSSVDGFFYPVTITALDAGGNAISQVGQPIPSSITGDKVVQSYKPFMATLTANGEDASAYNIMQQNPNPVPGSTAIGLINPGLYLQQNTPESINNSLHAVFDNALTTMFTNSTSCKNMSIWQNGTGTYSDFFTVTAVTASYPFPAGNANTHSALTFTGNTSGNIFTVFNPVGFSVVNYQGSGNDYYQITGTIQDGVLTFDNLTNPMPANTPLAVGMYVNTSGGTTDGTTQITAITNDPTGNYIASVTLSGSKDSSTSCQYMFSKAPTNFYFSSGCMVLAGLGLMADGGIRLDTTDPNVQTVTNGLENQIATALNRGVGVVDFSAVQGAFTGDGHTTDNWATETNWYPKLQPQNFFSLFMHTATVGDENIFTLPQNAVATARGSLMAMSYGFCYDENPMHSIPGPQVPSEFPVPFPENTASLKLTLGPWYTSSLTMAANLEEGGTISPEKGSHDHHYVSTVPLTATAAGGYQFGRWNVSGNCTVDKPGTSGASLTLTGANATATANFAKIQDISSISAGGKISVTDLADSHRGMKKLFVFNVTDESNFTLTTSGGTGDCDLYVKHGMAPNLADYQHKSTSRGNGEIVTIKNPAAGDWYVLLYSAADFADVNLDIEVNSAVPKKPSLIGSISGTKVNLSWSIAAGEKYDIYRSETNSTSSASVICSNLATLSYQEAFTGTYHYYWVKAKKEDPGNPGKYSESDFSDVAHPKGPDVILKNLSNGVPATGISGDAFSTKTYQIDVPDGQVLLEIKAYGGKGEYDLAAGMDGSPEKYRALIDSSLEIIRIENPTAGSYLIQLYGKTRYTGAAIVAKYYGVAPERVTGLTASQGSFPDRIILGWKDSPGATFYEIWRSETKLLDDASKIGDASDNSYEDNTGLEAEFIYHYWIKAGNSAGTSKESASASGYLMKIPSLIPTGVKASNSHFDKIVVTWPRYAGASSYLVYRNTVSNSDGAVFLAEMANVNYMTKYSYDNIGDDLTMGNTYYYFIKAKNGSGISDFSLAAKGNLNNKGPASIDASKGTYFGKVRVTWPAVPGAMGYDVHRYTDKGLTQGEQVYNAVGNLFYDDVAAVKGTTYYYRIKAKYKNAEYKTVYSLFSPSDSGYHSENIASLSAPAIKSVTRGSFGFVRITWSMVTLAENYKIYRNTVNAFGTSQLIATSANTSCDDITAIPDTTYWYWIKANNDPAEATSIPSASMSGFARSASTGIADGGSAITDGAKNSYKFYAIDVLKETTRLVINLDGTSTANNCELYVKLASYPSTSAFNEKGLDTGGGKTLTVTNPAEGTWYILLYGRTDYTNVTLSVKCYSVSDIIVTEAPLNNCLPSFTLKFKGQVIDQAGKGIPGLNLQARDPVTGNTTWLAAKTNAGGFWTFNGNLDREGVYAFDFFFTSLPELAKGTATHTVFTRKDCWNPDGYFDFSSYMTGLSTALNLGETIGLQEYLNIRKGWNTGAIDKDSENIWITGTLGKASSDTAILNNMDDGLYMLFYAFDGTGCGNDLTADSALRPSPLLVHVTQGKLNTVADNLVALGVLGDTQKNHLLAGKTVVVTVAALSNPGEDVSNDRDVSLMAREQLEALANLAANNSKVSFTEDRKFGDVMTKVVKIKVDGDTHEFSAATECFIKP
jgi:fibronectin type 3 domain-containing protein